MAHGEKDYTRTTAAKVVAANVDFDLPVILIDRFDSANFLWATAGAPVDYDAGMEAGAAYEGDAGLAMRTSLAAAGGGESVDVLRYAFTTTTRKLSFSTLFRINQDHSFVRDIQFLIRGRYNEQNYRAGIRYRADDVAWDYLTTGVTWVQFLQMIVQDTNTWQRVYFELDLENMQYIAFETADRRENLLGTAITYNTLLGIELMFVNLHLENQAAGTRADVSIDNVIIKELGS